MKKISKYFNHICTQKYSSLGFSKNKSAFIRMRGDILQTFALKCSHMAPTCSVTFGILPLCSPQPVYFDEGQYALNNFIIEVYDGWIFDSDSYESVMKCVESILQAIDLYLMPLFERCYDCKTSLPELIKLDELFDRNRQTILRLKGDSDLADPWHERSLFDSRKYYMSLKAHDWSYARKYLNFKVDFYKKRIKSFDSPDSPKQPKSVIERFLAGLSLHLKLLESLESEDFAPFDEMIRLNEIQMYKLLGRKFLEKQRIAGKEI